MVKKNEQHRDELIGVDVGGTFTDIIRFDQKTGKILLRRSTLLYLSTFTTIRAMSSSIKTGKPGSGTESIMSKKKHGTCMVTF